MNCPNCNSEVNGNQKFCPNCGTSLSNVRYCANCGNQLPEGVNFCPECGAPVASANASNAAPVQDYTSSASYENPNDSLYIETEEASQNRNRMYIWITIGITAVILAAIACVFIGDYIGREKKAKQMLQEIELREAAKQVNDSAVSPAL